MIDRSSNMTNSENIHSKLHRFHRFSNVDSFRIFSFVVIIDICTQKFIIRYQIFDISSKNILWYINLFHSVQDFSSLGLKNACISGLSSLHRFCLIRMTNSEYVQFINCTISLFFQSWFISVCQFANLTVNQLFFPGFIRLNAL